MYLRDFANFYGLQETDLTRVLRIIGLQFDIKRGPVLAGGAIIRWFNKEEEADFDIYCFSQKQEEKILKILMKKYKLLKVSNYVYTFKVLWYTVQIVQYSFHKGNNVKQVFSKFDFTVCKVATDGKKIVYKQNWVSDVVNKKLKIKHIKTAEDTLRRIIKYTSRGYTMSYKQKLEFLTKVRHSDILLSNTADVSEL